ncbi:hypothetical protein [Sporomusa acidovorans]|uniref:Uncharacterized protein n=1 Tax=Sporomusa acidovorans (strain ATCC 49682 / DSM 3132 / Mol) TaxID=1123286 RepID=A0ABZ3J700_SPOA4|nr:hypothetical protein [Sporomusa acidovorans]OZC18547.1 hypothetical protein SPACI_34140 [Sporomusa acidovorans DSM 3132]SDE38054.1 hypothetical protein SAMN04488499_101283 [Sporomusa acidovorans]
MQTFKGSSLDKDDILAREIIQESLGGKDPELALAEDFLEELDVRLEQIKVYYPIMEMLRKRKMDTEFMQLVPELCFLLLAYLIYEGKLKHKGLTFGELETFITKALRHIMANCAAAARELITEILDGLQNGGRNFVLTTYNLKTGSFREKYIKLIEIKQSEENVLEYFITEQGVDFYLRTKEFPEETKITINLLLFQKQMEKGAFGFAYDTVKRLNMEVQKKKDKKYSLLEALMYGQLDSGEAYNRYHRSIVLQFEEEAELFNTAVKNVNMVFHEYVDRIQNGLADEKQVRTFTLIKIIEKEIGRAQTLHTELLKEAVSFTKEYDNALGVRRKAIFTERFNFQNEFEKLVSQNDRPEAMKFLFEPLMNPYVRKQFNLLRAFEPQRVAQVKAEAGEEPLPETVVNRITVDKLTSRRVRGNFVFYAARLLEMLSNPKREISLKAFGQMLMDRFSEDSVYNGDFISFILELNRDKKIGEHVKRINFANGKIDIDEDLKTMEAVFVKAALSLPGQSTINQVVVTTFPDSELELLPGLKITDMMFIGESKS